MINKITLTLLLMGLIATGASAQQMKLLARAKAQGTNEATQDSVVYFHSGTKGNNPPGKYNIPEYELMEDSAHVYTINNGNIALTQRIVKYYTGNDLDSSVTYELDNGSWKAEARTVVSFSGNKPDTIKNYTWSSWGGGGWRLSSYNVYTWSGNDAATISNRRRFQWGGYRWDYRITRSYSSGNTIDSLFEDWQGNDTSGSWQNEYKIAYTYSAGQLASYFAEQWVSGAWQDKDKGTYSNNAGTRELTTEYYDAMNTTWIPDDKYTWYMTGSNPPDSMIYVNNTFGSNPPQYINQRKHIYTHNSAGQQVTERIESWDGTTSWVYTGSDTTIRHYYGWNVNVEEVKTSENKILIYPSPANDVINIEVAGAYSKGEVEFAIVNMQGRVVKSWKDRDAKAATVTVRELPAGNYILMLSNSNQSRSERFTIVK